MEYHFEIDAKKSTKEIEKTEYKIIPLVISDYLIFDEKYGCFVLVEM